MMYNIVHSTTDVIHDEERCLTMAPASNDHPSSYLPQMTQTRRAQHAVLWLFVAQERWNGFVFRYVKRRGEVENSAVQQRCDTLDWQLVLVDSGARRILGRATGRLYLWGLRYSR